jgi:hypothetical protein
MDKSFFRTLIIVTAAACVFLITSILLFQLPGLQAQTADFVYPVYTTVLFFYGLSVIILFALHLISSKNPGQTGYVFLLLTTLQVVGAYLYIRPVLSKTIEIPAEKVSIFVIFMLFLLLEAYFTSVLLNKKQ